MERSQNASIGEQETKCMLHGGIRTTTSSDNGKKYGH
jgi:hypothetical protein